MSTRIPFKALFLAPQPATFMRADDGQRTDVPELVRIVTELSAPDRVVAARSDAQYATDIATAGTNELTNSGILGRADTWVDNAFAALTPMISALPAHSDAIYFIISPEFALNGHVSALPESDITRKWDAGAPIYKDIEVRIQDRIRHQMQQAAFVNTRIVFAFSIATYDARVLPPYEGRGTHATSVNGACYSIIGDNRINIVMGKGAVVEVKYVHKREPASGDGGDKWPTLIGGRQIFSQRLRWANNANIAQFIPAGVTVPADPAMVEAVAQADRTLHTAIDLPWNDAGDQHITIAFGTCYDVRSDVRHGVCNMAIYIGAGLPFELYKDTVHSSLSSCTHFWTQNKAHKRPGYYIPSLNAVNEIVKFDLTAAPLADADFSKVLALYQAQPGNAYNSYRDHVELYADMDHLWRVNYARGQQPAGGVGFPYEFIDDFFDIPTRRDDPPPPVAPPVAVVPANTTGLCCAIL